MKNRILLIFILAICSSVFGSYVSKILSAPELITEWSIVSAIVNLAGVFFSAYGLLME